MPKKSKRSKKGGSPRRSTRTRIPTVVEPVEELTRDQLSSKIQWLIDFAGTRDVMQNIIKNFAKPDCKKTTIITVNGEINDEDITNKKYKNTLVFNTRTGDVGHWIYFTKDGEEFNSYKRGHQKPATNQFCQSFATLYFLHNCGLDTVPKFYNQLQQANSTMRLSDRHDKWGHNVEVIIEMWKWIFSQWSAKTDMNTWCINELKEINEEYNAFNAKTRIKKNKMTPISENADNITMSLITSKLDDIIAHKREIAEKT